MLLQKSYLDIVGVIFFFAWIYLVILAIFDFIAVRKKSTQNRINFAELKMVQNQDELKPRLPDISTKF